MSDWLVIAIGIVVAVGASLGCVAVIRRVQQRPDDLQRMLNRDPLFGKDFFAQYYADLPRRIVFDVRAEFAALLGVPSDFVLPQDKLTSYAPAESAEAMRNYIAALVSSIRDSESSAAIPQELATLDDYIRAAAQLSVAPPLESARKNE